MTTSIPLFGPEMMSRAIYNFKMIIEQKIKRRKPEMERNYVDTPGLKRIDAETHFEVTNMIAQGKLNSLKQVRSTYIQTRDSHSKDMLIIEERVHKFDIIIQQYDSLVEAERNFLSSAADKFEKLSLNRDAIQTEEESNDENLCRICMEPFDKETRHRSVIFTCRHQFCFACLHKLLKEKKECAICRKQFEEKDIFKLF